jgi:hypothetical protein
VLADTLDQHGHLVGDEAGVGLGIRQYGQAGAADGGGDEQQGWSRWSAAG